MSYILAFDVGTTAVKANLVHCETKEMYGAGAPCDLWQPYPGWAEQDADKMWDAVCRASHGCIAAAKIDPSRIIGTVISAPWKHVIPLDETGTPLRKSIIWMDGRAIEQAQRLNSVMGRFVEHAQGYWSRLLWLKENEPEIWAKAKYIVGINDYFKYRATGNLCTECSDDFIHSPNEKLQRLYDEVLKKTGLAEDIEKFPQPIACTDCVGYLTQAGAKQLGLQEGIPLFGGFGDLPAVHFGSGCSEEGTAHIYLGTSSWLGELLPDRVEDYARGWFTADETHQGAIFGLTTGGRAYEWAINRFYKEERERLGDGIYALLEREMAQTAPGCNGLIVTHWLNGEAPPLSKNAKAVFFNVTEQHQRQHFVRAMLESICYTHRRSLEKYIRHHGRPPKRLRVVGGGACSDVWMQMMADILKIPVQVPENPRYVGTMGSCYCALIGMGIKKDFTALNRQDGGKIFTPNPENEEIYDKMYGIYLDLYPSLKSLYDRMNGVY